MKMIGIDGKGLHKTSGIQTSEGLVVKTILSIILFVMLFACSSAPPRFNKQPGEQERGMVRTFPHRYDAVWKGVEDVTSEYRIHTKNREQGILFTRWKMTVVRNMGRLSEDRNFSHGIKIREYSDSVDPHEQGQFEVHNRLQIRVIPEGDSTTVAVTNYFWVNTHDYDPDRTVPFGNKAFSTWEFDTREEFKVLDRIGEIAARAEKK